MKVRLIRWAAILGGTGVMLGALGAHALKKILPSEQLLSFETGVRYQIFHALLLLIIAIFGSKVNSIISRLIIIGVLLFSGSIYLLSLNKILQIDLMNILGPITPIGGLCLIAAWVLLAYKAKDWLKK